MVHVVGNFDHCSTAPCAFPVGLPKQQEFLSKSSGILCHFIRVHHPAASKDWCNGWPSYRSGRSSTSTPLRQSLDPHGPSSLWFRSPSGMTFTHKLNLAMDSSAGNEMEPWQPRQQRNRLQREGQRLRVAEATDERQRWSKLHNSATRN